jgi:hypothetical protein
MLQLQKLKTNTEIEERTAYIILISNLKTQTLLK